LLLDRFNFTEELAVRNPYGVTARQVLPAPDRSIDIERIEFDAAADATRSFGCKERRATTKKGVKNDLATVRAVKQNVYYEVDRLSRWMQCE